MFSPLLNELSVRTNNPSQGSDVSVTYERVLESEPLIELIPEIEDKLEGVLRCLRAGDSIVSELDEVEQKQQTIEHLLKLNGELIQRVVVSCKNDK